MATLPSGILPSNVHHRMHVTAHKSRGSSQVMMDVLHGDPTQGRNSSHTASILAAPARVAYPFHESSDKQPPVQIWPRAPHLLHEPASLCLRSQCLPFRPFVYERPQHVTLTVRHECTYLLCNAEIRLDEKQRVEHGAVHWWPSVWL